MSDAAPASAPIPGTPRWSRRRTISVTTITIGLVALLIAGWVYVGHYQPMNGGTLALADTRFATPWGESDGIDNSTPLYRATYQEGQTLRYGFFLRNSGPLGITVTSLQRPAEPGDEFMLEPAGIAVGDGARPASVDPRRLRPFAPFSLGPGAERFVVLEWRFRHCRPQNAGVNMTFYDTDVTYRVLGFVHRAYLQLPIAVQVPNPPRADCPNTGGSSG